VASRHLRAHFGGAWLAELIESSAEAKALLRAEQPPIRVFPLARSARSSLDDQ
jgi:hypothetical protein